TQDVNSATSEWYFNVIDNSVTLSPSNGGGYTVFGRVLGTGMSVVDAIAALRVVNASGTQDPNQLFGMLPVRNYTSGPVGAEHVVLVNSIAPATLFPAGGEASIVGFTVENSVPSVAASELNGSILTVTPLSPGTTHITVRATDLNGNQAQGAFAVNVAAGVPVFSVQPVSQTIATGSTVVFNATATGAGTYRW